jgi:hypothetical protein
MKFILSGGNYGGMDVTVNYGDDLVGIRDKNSPQIWQYRCNLNEGTTTAEFVGMVTATDEEFAAMGGVIFTPPPPEVTE